MTTQIPTPAEPEVRPADSAPQAGNSRGKQTPAAWPERAARPGEREASRAEKAARGIFLLICLAVLFIVPLWTLLGPRSGVSFWEQRTLTPAPSVTAQGIWDGTFFTGTETALADHIAWRDSLLKTNTALDLALGRTKVNGLVVGGDKLLDCHGFSRWDLSYLTGQAAQTAEGYGALREKIAACGGYFCYLGVPLQSTYFADHYPAYMDSRLWHTTAIRNAFGDAMQAADVPFINLYKVCQAQGMPEEYYFDSDHHYTLRGAFAAYETVLEKLRTDAGLTVAEPEFQWSELEGRAFLGSANRKLYGLWQSRDQVVLARPEPAIPFTRTDNGRAAEPSVFALPASEKEAATYSVYMGGDLAETVIETGRTELPDLLIYGDSFTNALETMIWTGFDETRSLDFRYYDAMSLEDYIDRYRPDVVLCVRDETVYLSGDGNGIT